jgi:hypothetical protein
MMTAANKGRLLLSILIALALAYAARPIFALVLAIAMILTWFLAWLRRDDLTRRPALGTACCTVLCGTGFFCFCSRIFSDAVYEQIIHPDWSNAVLALGGLACILPVINHPRRVGSFVFPFMASIMFTVFALGSQVMPVGASAKEFAAWTARQKLGVEKTPDWKRAADVVEWLRSTGRIDPNLASLERPFHEAMDAWMASGHSDDRVNSYTLACATRMDILTEEESSFLVSQPICRRLLEKSGPMLWIEQREAYLNAMIVKGHLKVDQYDHLLERLAATWKSLNMEHEPRTAEWLCLCRLADLFGVSDELAGGGEDIHGLLKRMWVHPPDLADENSAPRAKDVGGFGSGTSSPRRTASAGDTLDALELMLHFGVPDDIDIRLLQNHLRGKTRRHGLFSWGIRSYNLYDKLAWEKLDASGLVSPLSLTVFIRSERLFLCSILLVLLGIHATYRAPRHQSSRNDQGIPIQEE